MGNPKREYGLTRHPLGSSLFGPFFSQFPSLFDDERQEYKAVTQSNISLSEDDNHVYVEANLPGLKEDDIEISLDNGMLWVKGQHQEKEEDKEKKFYYKANRAFSYRITLPSDIDESVDPTAEFKNGVIYITFKKAVEAQPKKISIKRS